MKKKPTHAVRVKSMKAVKKSNPGKKTAKAIEKKLAEIKLENARPAASHTHLSLFRSAY